VNWISLEGDPEELKDSLRKEEEINEYKNTTSERPMNTSTHNSS
jgi:hypothetical protein